MIISEAKISSTAARRSKFKVACQMEACAGSSKLSGAVCELSSHHPNLLIKQNTCGSIQTLRHIESLSYGNLWKSREEEQIQTPHLLHILAQIQLASLQSMENECWLLNGWLRTYIGNIPEPSSLCLQTATANKAEPVLHTVF